MTYLLADADLRSSAVAHVWLPVVTWLAEGA